jgi:hypothetical protein
MRTATSAGRTVRGDLWAWGMLRCTQHDNWGTRLALLPAHPTPLRRPKHITRLAPPLARPTPVILKGAALKNPPGRHIVTRPPMRTTAFVVGRKLIQSVCT